MFQHEISPLVPKVFPSKLEVGIELLSSWGASGRVGLTEIQLFDLAGKKIDLDPDSIVAHRALLQKGELSALCNGKSKVS